MLFQLPNVLTYARIFFIPMIVVCLFIDAHDPILRMSAFILFALSGVSDFLDGWLARKWNMQSVLGKMLDPIADKLLISVILVMLVYTKDITGVHIFATLIILCREILVSGLREYLATVLVSVPVSYLAKWKTTFQILALGFLVIGSASVYVHPLIPAHNIGLCLLWVAAILTVYTGLDYIKYGLIHMAKL